MQSLYTEKQRYHIKKQFAHAEEMVIHHQLNPLELGKWERWVKHWGRKLAKISIRGDYYEKKR